MTSKLLKFAAWLQLRSLIARKRPNITFRQFFLVNRGCDLSTDPEEEERPGHADNLDPIALRSHALRMSDELYVRRRLKSTMDLVEGSRRACLSRRSCLAATARIRSHAMNVTDECH